MDNQLPQQVSELIERFERNQQSYTSSQYNEAQLRQEFINSFFEALGWDVRNINGNAEAYKDVILEDAIKIGSAIKAPDYCFRIGGTRKFFVEAKKPSIKIDDNIDAAFQLRRYAWSAKLPLGILTNFKEFAVYDCRIDPVKDDKASTARISYFIYKDYPQQWDYLVSVFSKESVLKGSFDKYAESSKLKRGTATVDEKFLKEIESWRSGLAHKIAIRNTKLTTRELNFAVQRTIDRIIFLRICEDRGMEQYGKLQSMMNGVNVYKRLFELFQRADQRYNSGLFHFSKERDREEEPDNLTPFLNIDDEPIKDIINRLYYPESPYEFSVLSADILGQVYEQFLGKVIRLTEGHHAKIEEKPEVRKAGGIYYTPTYIVDYIVKNSVGKLVEGKTPKQISKLRILDPACGSGSFLIGAFQYLLDWHLDWYVKDGAEKYAKAARPILYQAGGTHAGHGSGSYRLTTYERKRILLNNIYGVDIDPQAVEVTKLSLLLKVLEGENSQTLDVQFKLFHERALPDLENNIKCGNSLIGPDFYQQQSLNLFNDDELLRINAFDWNAEFKDIMTSGGFDAVIGNPPYVFTRNQGIDDKQKSYFYSHFKHQSNQLNTFGIFVEQSHKLLHKKGMLGFITPNNWYTIDSFSPLRKFILEASANIKMINIVDRVFVAADVDTGIILFEKNNPTNLTISEMKNQQEVFSHKVGIDAIQSPSYIININFLNNSHSQKIIQKIETIAKPLSSFCTVSTGLKAYQIGKGKPHQTNKEKDSRIFHASSKKDKTYGKYLDGVDVCRYRLDWSGEYLSYGEWLAEPRKSVPFTGERLLVRQIPSKPPYLINGVFTDEQSYNDINSMVIFSPAKNVYLKYLLGLINSRLLSVWFEKTYDKLQRRIFPQFKVKELARFPICPINFSDPSDKARHDKMVTLVDQMLSLNKQLPSAKTEHEKTALQRQIDAIDKQIDELVYDLYGITEEERKIIEG